ncbi:serine/threonine-protein kinase [Botrimarina sp.]|uniref:WD40 repeat domain-containing serine/threonine protein kinase n=1 Tax=Botrimarina sp. TaxID=2795802 RepID=UPI0032ECA567
MQECPNCHRRWDPASHAACPWCAGEGGSPADEQRTLDAQAPPAADEEATPQFDSGFFGVSPADDATFALDPGGEATGGDEPTLAGGAPTGDLNAAPNEDFTLAIEGADDDATPDLAESGSGGGSASGGSGSAGGSSRSDPNAATIDRESDTFAFTESPATPKPRRPTERDLPGASRPTPRGMPTGRTSASLKPGESISIESERVRLKSHLLGGAGPPAAGEASPPDTLDYEHAEGPWEGGMGQVWKSRQATLDRFVAIKQVRSDNPTDRDRSKLVSEAVITGSLEHPNIIPVHDLGVDGNGLPFYSMKFVGGLDWDDARDQRSMSEADNLAVLVQVAQAIAFAHSRGVIHMDLKPNNIRLGDFGEVLVMDWGLAARIDRGAIEPGGTPSYMAPELALPYYRRFLEFTPEGRDSLSKSEQDRALARAQVETPPGPYSDIYLLGALLYWIVTGRPPHRGKDRFRLLQSAARNTIAATSRRTELLEIAYKAMATDPANRHASASEFIESIKGYQEHAQSVEIARRASRELKSAQEMREDRDAEPKGLYEAYARARHGFENALALWPGNSKAQRRLERTLRYYAEAAYAGGDYDLALSMLDAESEADAQLRNEVLTAQQRRQSRDAWYRTLQYATAASLLAALVFIGISGYYGRLAHQEIRRADRATARADEQTRLADTAKAEARLATTEAADARQQADAALAQAAGAKSEADAANRLAQQATAQARDAQQEADVAREAARDQRYLAAIASVRSILAEDGAYAASKALHELGAALTPEQRDAREWRRLERLARWRDEATELRGAGDGESRVATSADGRWLAVATTAGGATEVTLSPTQRPDAATRSFAAPTPIEEMVLSHDGRYLASRGERFAVWDTTSGKRLEGGPDGATAFSFHPTDHRLVVGGADTSVSVWGIGDNDKLVQESTDGRWHRAPIVGAGYSPDGRLRYSADAEGIVRVWRVGGGELPWSYRHNAGSAGSAGVTCAAMTDADRGARLAYGCTDGAAYEVAGPWSGDAPPAQDWIDATPVRLRDSHLGPVATIHYADGGELIVTTGVEASLVRLAPAAEADAAAPKRVRQYHDRPLVAAAVGAGAFAYTADASGRVVRWRIDAPPVDLVLESDDDRAAAVTRLALDPATGAVSAADAGGFVHVWPRGRATADPRALYVGHSDNRAFRVWAIGSPTPALVSVAADDAACVWSGDTGQLLDRFDLGRRDVVDVTEAGVLVAAAPGRPAFALSLADGARRELWAGGPRVAAVAALTPDASRVAVGLRDGQLYLWSRDGGRVELMASSVRPHWRPIRSMSHEASTGELLVGDSGGVVSRWRIGRNGGELLGEWLLDEPHPVTRVGVSDGGRLFALQAWGGVTTLHRWRDGAPRRLDAASPILDAANIDGRLVALTASAELMTFDAVSGEPTPRDAAAPAWWSVGRPTGIAASPSGGSIVHGEGAADWRQTDGSVVRVRSRPLAASLLLGAGDPAVLAVDRGGVAHRWAGAGATPRAIPLDLPGPVVAATPLPASGGSSLVLVDNDGSTSLYRVAAAAERTEALGESIVGRGQRLAASGSWAAVAIGGPQRGLYLIDLNRVGPWERLPPPRDERLSALAVSPTGGRVAVVYEGGACDLLQRSADRWSVARLDQPGVNAAAFSPDGERLIVGLGSGQVLALLIEDQAEMVAGIAGSRRLLTLAGHAGPVTVLGYAADERTLLSGDASGGVVALEF